MTGRHRARDDVCGDPSRVPAHVQLKNLTGFVYSDSIIKS